SESRLVYHLSFNLYNDSTLSVFLHITEATGRTWKTQIRPGKSWLIGRAKENDVVLNDRRVSRKHAFIEMDGLDFRVVDGYVENGQLLRSVNHVFVNGTMQLEHTLAEGDVIMIGESSLEFHVEADAKSTRDLSPIRSPSQVGIAKPKTVSFDDSPLGHTQVAVSVNELMGPRSDVSLESAVATPQEIKDLRRKAKILELLYEMSKTLGTVLELDELFTRATDLIFRGTPADRVVALLIDDETGELVQVAARVREKSIEKLSENLAVSRTITKKVVTERVAILSQDAKTDEQFQGAESIVSQGVRSTICAPLITPSGVHGVLYADRLDPFAAFRPDHLDLISAVGAQAAITVETVKAHKRLAREEVARANYARFMPEYVVKQLLENPDSFKLGGANQTITVLFADIRGFTGISETENPEKIVGLLNHYFSAMSDIIFDHGGTLDKYIGDGLMALFGAPTATPADAVNAVMTAVAMQRRLLTLNPELLEQGYGQIAVGIGLHTGEATVGYIGSEKRSEYTAIGDTVNLASRLESNSSGGQILISEATATAAGDIFPLVGREPLTVKNRKQPVNIFEVKWA
ncbi:MAG TPA: adenylate/guanylate cyclase domain-containing protein, partial [Pyrinomonadaceae bacterium]|nr:adenylate/guanylate cyclase domain-containing protein [Pyrinomonadaceae bacterium]